MISIIIKIIQTQALDYVSDYQLESACKDVICLIVLSKVTQIIFRCFRGLIIIITSSLHTVLNWQVLHTHTHTHIYIYIYIYIYVC